MRRSATTFAFVGCLLLALSLATQVQGQGNGKNIAVFCEIEAGSVSPVPGAITCPAGTYVYIANAFWGRRDTGQATCETVPSTPYFAGYGISTKCEGAGTTIYDAFKFCNNNPSQTCAGLEPSVDVLGSPVTVGGQSCSNIYKFLEVTYYCVSNNCNSQGSFASTGFTNTGIFNNPPTSDCGACANGFSGANCEISPCIDAAGDPNQNCFNGSCNATTGKCDCAAGFGGTTCQCNNDTDCNASGGNGTCDNTKQSGCVCNAGFGGLDCACVAANCTPGQGVCDPAGTAGACSCNAGFGGANCSCTQAACNPKGLTPAAGQCNPTATDGSCQCNAPWTGLDCGCNSSTDCGATASPIAQGQCNASGTIDNSPCTCTPGFGGLHCNCVNAACGNNSTGTCNNTKEDECSCFAGYGGADCSCRESLCSHNNQQGTCDPAASGSTLSSPKCICNAAAGFGGETCGCDKNAENKVNGCFGNGECASDWDCDCQAGWFGDHCNCSEELCNWQGCNSRTGDCICPTGWGGANCQCHPVITSKLDFHGTLDANGTCNQVDAPDPSTGNRCQADGSCACATGFNGPNCECSDVERFPGDTKKHCNGRGTCQADGSCLCNVDGQGQPLYAGDQCQCSNTPDLANPSLFHCSGHGTCAGANSCVCDPGWAGVQCDICAPTYYPKTTDTANFPAGPYCVNQCKDATNTVEQSLTSTGALSCNNHGTCGGSGVCTCDAGYVNDDTAFATDGDCDAQYKLVCPGAGLSLTCPSGQSFVTLHSDYGINKYTNLDPVLASALSTAGCASASSLTCTNTADNAKSFVSTICDGTIGASFGGCSLAVVNDLTLAASWALGGGSAPCATDTSYLTVVYQCNSS